MKTLNAKQRKQYKQRCASVEDGSDGGIFWFALTRCPHCGFFLLAKRAEDDAVICSRCHEPRKNGDSTEPVGVLNALLP